jgi:hypothetical protein
MSKPQDIDDIMEQPQYDLMLQVLWDDPATQAKIRSHLNSISAENIVHYHKRFRPDKHEAAKGKQ